MKLALFDDLRLGAVDGDDVVDVTAALPWPHDDDPLTAGWWRRLCRDFDQVRGHRTVRFSFARGEAEIAEGVSRMQRMLG